MQPNVSLWVQRCKGAGVPGGAKPNLFQYRRFYFNNHLAIADRVGGL
jgi:hypothetical protein